MLSRGIVEKVEEWRAETIRDGQPDEAEGWAISAALQELGPSSRKRLRWLSEAADADWRPEANRADIAHHLGLVLAGKLSLRQAYESMYDSHGGSGWIKWCRVCGETFEAVRSDAVTCSPRCRQRKRRNAPGPSDG